jgi:hypothetical protein
VPALHAPDAAASAITQSLTHAPPGRGHPSAGKLITEPMSSVPLTPADPAPLPGERDVIDQKARDLRQLNAQPSSPPEPLAEAARALLEAPGKRPRRCQKCGQPFTGRATRRTCSGRCRAALSRQRESEAQAERDGEIRELLLQALRLLDNARPHFALWKNRGTERAQAAGIGTGVQGGLG